MKHREQYGRPWSIGADVARLVLEATHGKPGWLLDFGCGAGRVGRHLIPHCDIYVGVDHDAQALKDFLIFEIPEGSSRWLLSPSLPYGGFNTILDFYASYHTGYDVREQFHAHTVLISPWDGWMPAGYVHVQTLTAPVPDHLPIELGHYVKEP